MMKNRKNNIYRAIGYILLVTLFVGGCADMNQLEDKITQKFEDNRDIFLAHMEEKYDKTFLPISYTGESAIVNEEFRCYVEGTDKEKDVVSVFRKEENGKEVFYDDYFGLVVRDEYERKVEELCRKSIGENKVILKAYELSYFDNALTAENTLDDAILMGQSIDAFKYVFFEVIPGDKSVFEAVCQQMCEEMSDAKLTGSVNFYGLAPGELEKITVDNYESYMPDLLQPDGTICLMISKKIAY